VKRRSSRPRTTPTPRRPATRAVRTRAHESAPFALDGTLVTSAALLAGLGVVMNYSTTAALAIGEPIPPLALRHGVGIAFAAVCAAIAARLSLLFWARISLLAYGISIALLALAPLLGIEANGAQRWLAVPGLPISLQPSETARLFTILALAAVLAASTEHGRPRPAVLKTALPLVALPALLLLLQPDFGSAVVLIATAGLLLFASGLSLRFLALPGAAALLLAGAYVAAKPYALARLRGFLDPWRHASDEGFQLVQSFVAFGRGGAFGVGLGSGRQKLSYLPEAHTDFILSVVAEELGLLGVLVVLGAFATLALAGLRIARRAKSPLALLVATGMTVTIVLPGAINAGVVMGLLPTTGLTLPFLSHGSNSLVCTALALGILLRIGAREAAPESTRVRGAAPRRWARA
jgi:cell division protein FtsW